MPADVLPLLQAACAGLLFPSERDEPLVPFLWNDAATEIDAPALLRLIGRPAETRVESADPDLFFQNAAADQGWHDEAEKDAGRRFQELLQLMKSLLRDLKAFRVGAIEIDAYVVGRAAGGEWAGVRTKLIET
jgi:histidine triad (HIT) family protein